MVLTMSKKAIFPLKNKSTNTSLDALTIIGVDRPGLNEYTNSVIAIDIDKKKELWRFQETSHDIWNLDIPAAPTPAITTFSFLIFLLTTFVEFNKPARTTTAVPC